MVDYLLFEPFEPSSEANFESCLSSACPILVSLGLPMDPDTEDKTSLSVCMVCLHPMPLWKDGAVCVHSPVACRCPGSGKHPRSAPPAMTHLSREPQLPLVHQHALQIAPSPSPDISLLCVRLLKRLPQASHNQAAKNLTTVMDEVNRHNNVTGWTRLLNFPRQSFRDLGMGRQQWNLARQVNQQLA